MRTTLDIPDPLYRRLKATAALRGCTVKEIVLKLIEREIAAPSARKRRIRLPLIESDRPGTLRLTNAQINEILFP
jgi:hypothetical protein